MAIRRWIFHHHAGGRISCLPIAALLYVASALAVSPNAKAQDINEVVSRNLRDLKSKNAETRTQAAVSLVIILRRALLQPTTGSKRGKQFQP